MAALLALLSLLPLAPITIQSARLLTSSPSMLQMAELEVKLSAKVDHPFDRRAFALDAVITDPTGQRIRMPGFLYQAYRRTYRRATRPIAYASVEALRKGSSNVETKDGTEVMEPTGVRQWRIRFTPLRAGVHRVKVVTSSGGSFSLSVPVKKAKSTAGFVRRSRINPFAFSSSTGGGLFPIGANLCWGGHRGTADFDDWIPKYSRAGADWGRLWLGPAWTTFALETAGSDQGQTRFGDFNLADAWRVDYVLDLARRNGLRLQLAIDSYNLLRDREAWPEWERSAYNQATGGPLKQPLDFWTNPEALAHYENKLAYIVARWGASPNVFAWEFWNEVDGVSAYREAPIKPWHQRMARKLRALDPYAHLITTSFGGGGPQAGDAAVFGLPEIDYSSSHLYNVPKIGQAVFDERQRLGALGKPWFVGETGLDAAGPREKDDPKGYQLHDSLWASVASGASGGAMLWWWDSYIEPRNLYGQYRSVRRFLQDVDWESAQLRPVAASGFCYSVGPKLAIAWLPQPSSSVQLSGLTKGAYRIEVLDPWRGEVVRTLSMRVEGPISVALPAATRDLAIKAVKVQPPTRP